MSILRDATVRLISIQETRWSRGRRKSNFTERYWGHAIRSDFDSVNRKITVNVLRRAVATESSKGYCEALQRANPPVSATLEQPLAIPT